METSDSRSVSSLRDQQTELDPDLNGAHSLIVDDFTPQLDFANATNRIMLFVCFIETGKDVYMNETLHVE